MSRTHKIKALAFVAIGIIFVFWDYVIVIGQTSKPVLVALNKADSTLAIIDPMTMKITGKVATGDSPHEVVLSADGKTAFVGITEHRRRAARSRSSIPRRRRKSGALISLR